MSLWVALISAVQSVDKETFASKQYVGQIVLKLAYHVAKKRNQFEQTKKAIKESEERKKIVTVFTKTQRIDTKIMAS